MAHVRFCPECGHQNSATARYCGRCGSALAAPAVNSRRLWFALPLVVGLVCLVAAGTVAVAGPWRDSLLDVLSLGNNNSSPPIAVATGNKETPTSVAEMAEEITATPTLLSTASSTPTFRSPEASEASTPAPSKTPSPPPPAVTMERPTPAVNLESPEPVFAPDYDADDGLPTYICGADAFGSYYTLQQMQMAGKDVEHGFHLGIVPFFLGEDPAYDISEEQRNALLQAGQWDCLLTTLDAVALDSPGIITAIVDESAGADQLWGRDIATLNELQGKRISFARGSVGEYFTYYALSIARLSPRFDVTLVPQDSVSDAVAAFNARQSDAVSGWEPDIYEAEETGGVSLLSSSQLRIVIDVVATSRQSINNEPGLVQQFHDAWFDTLKQQLEVFDTAAALIADWGHNDWSFVYSETASEDLRLWLESVAQADLGDNAAVMRDLRPLVNRLQIARRAWAAAGLEVPDDDVDELVDPGFVARAAQQASLVANGNPVNDTFSIAAQIDLSAVDTEEAVTLAVLPCRRFSFLHDSTELTLESRRILDECAVPTMSQGVELLLEVTGSAAWPQNDPPYTEEEILEFAEARAQSVVDYLVSQGIDPARLIVTATLPPEAHRETDDPAIQAEDRYIELRLLTMPSARSATVFPTATPSAHLFTEPPTGQILFTCFIDGFDNICRMNADGSDQRRLTQPEATDFYASYSPDGRSIVFSSRRSGTFHLYMMDASGANVHQSSPDVGSLFAPAISPDGRQIAFTNAVADKQAIWVMNIDGSNAQALTDSGGNDVDPIWSPDGSQIAFGSDRSGTMAHYIMSANGSNTRILATDIGDIGGRSDWSPDGRWLAFYAGPENDRDIYLVSTDGSGEVRRLTDGGNNLAPAFSPDGGWIAFTSYRNGEDAEIFIMRIDGSEVRQLTDNDRPDWQPRWGP